MTSDTHSEINDSEDGLIEIGNYEENSTDALLKETPGSVSSNEFSTTDQKNKCEKRPVENIDFDPFLQIMQQQLDLIRQERQRESTMTNNPDYHFFMSLLPYFEKLDVMEKLQLRSNIQNVVLETLKQKELEKQRRTMYIPPTSFQTEQNTYHQFPQNTGQDLTISNPYTPNSFN
ncbi:unnamed protein product [Macrosiphum euphorbiae]|uniref:BESS domain-containing protein n=1 Tax=Macrosiphum euphorbiae TaxID=13131 RepID=A0AAV0Y235_9HEMI|nr:unnamed protein product [Macrosiphum euphorbiae]